MNTETTVPAAVPETKSFNGNFLVWKKQGQQLRRPKKVDPARPPRFRHPTFAAAEAEAQRLLGLHPDSTFVVLQEVARVKNKAAAVQADG